MTPAVQVIQNIDAAAALFSAPRLKILAELAEPDTAAAIARRVGLPRQQVSYHVRELEHAAFDNRIWPTFDTQIWPTLSP